MVFGNGNVFVFTTKPSANIILSSPQFCVTTFTCSNRIYRFPENPFKKIILK